MFSIFSRVSRSQLEIASFVHRAVKYITGPTQKEGEREKCDLSVEKRVKKCETKYWILAGRFVRGASHVYVLNTRYVLARTDGNIWRNETRRYRCEFVRLCLQRNNRSRTENDEKRRRYYGQICISFSARRFHLSFDSARVNSLDNFPVYSESNNVIRCCKFRPEVLLSVTSKYDRLFVRRASFAGQCELIA